MRDGIGGDDQRAGPGIAGASGDRIGLAPVGVHASDGGGDCDLDVAARWPRYLAYAGAGAHSGGFLRDEAPSAAIAGGRRLAWGRQLCRDRMPGAAGPSRCWLRAYRVLRSAARTVAARPLPGVA